jgi:hypothetical protein
MNRIPVILFIAFHVNMSQCQAVLSLCGVFLLGDHDKYQMAWNWVASFRFATFAPGWVVFLTNR